ncbi:MAG: flippase [bacterium]
MSIIKKTKTNFISLTVLSTVDRTASVILVLLMARYLGARTYGEYAFAFAVANIVLAFSDLGINTLLTRDLAKDPGLQQRYLSNALGIKIISTMLVLLLIAALNSVVPIFKESALVIFLVVLNHGLRVVSSTFIAVVRANMKMQYEAAAGILNRLLSLAGGVAALLAGYGLVTVVSVFLVASAIEFLYLAGMVQARFTPFRVRFDFAEQKRMVRKSLPFLLMIFLALVNYRLDAILLGILHGKEATGVYSAAYVLVLNLILFQQIAGRVLLPLLSQCPPNQKEPFQKYCRQTIKGLVVLALFVVLTVLGYSDQIISLLYSDDFQDAAGCLRILIFAVAFMFVSHILFIALIALKKERQVTKGWLAAVTVNVVLNLLLIPKFSYLGACAATVAAEFTLCVFNYYHLIVVNRYSLLPKLDWLKVGMPFLAGGIFILLIPQMSMFYAVPLLLLVYGLFLIVGRAFSRAELSDWIKFIRV